MEGWKKTAKTTSWAIGTPDTGPDIARGVCGKRVMCSTVRAKLCTQLRRIGYWEARMESL